MLRRRWWVMGLVLVLGGLTVALSLHAPTASVGWFAYTPPSNSANWSIEWGDLAHSGGSASSATPWRLAGYAAAAIGLAVLAAGTGHHLARRRGRSVAVAGGAGGLDGVEGPASSPPTA